MITTVSAYLEGVLYFAYGEGAGWSESYDLAADNPAEGLAALAELAQYRRAYFGFGVSVVAGRLSWSDRPELAWQVPGLPLGFLPSMKDNPADLDADYCPNDPWIAIVYRFETPSRRWANRLWAGIPDRLVYDFKQVGIVSKPLPAGMPLAAPGNPDGLSADYYRASLLRWLVTNTCHARLQTPVGVSPPSWEVEGWNAAKDHPLSHRGNALPFFPCPGRARAA